MRSWNQKRVIVVVVATVTAVGMTVIGLSQTLIYKFPPVVATSLWFPMAMIVRQLTGNELLMGLAALAQFPLLTWGCFYAARTRPFWKAGLMMVSLHCLLILMIALFAFGIRVFRWQ